MIHFSIPVTKECKHPEWTYGEICVKCGECGRFDKEFICINCGYTEGRKPLDVYGDWGSVEFYDLFSAPICPKCRLLFTKEDRTNYQSDIKKYGFSISHEIIPIKVKDFKARNLTK